MNFMSTSYIKSRSRNLALAVFNGLRNKYIYVEEGFNEIHINFEAKCDLFVVELLRKA